MITQERLKEVLHYEPTTGIFTWLETRGSVKAGDIAGTLGTGGYISIRINTKPYRAHRLAWLYMEGYFPEHDIDHKYRIPDDNRWSEIRHVTRQCNTRNSKKRKDNKSGITGVVWYKRTNQWYSQLIINRSNKYLGYYDDFDEAVKARWEAEVKYDFPNCNTTSTAYNYLKDKGLIN